MYDYANFGGYFQHLTQYLLYSWVLYEVTIETINHKTDSFETKVDPRQALAE